MTIRNPVRRRVARDVARIGAVCCALMLAWTTWITVEGGRERAYAVTGGTAGVFASGSSATLSSGGSATPFVVKPPDGSVCSGDSANAGFKVNTYMVPSSIDPSTLTFNNNGPIVPQGTFGQPMYNASTQGKITNLQTGPGDGLIVGIPPMTFGVYTAANPAPDGMVTLPPGTYNVGVVCALTTSQPYVLDKFWNVQITVAADGTDQPGGFSWTVEDTQATTTTSSTTTTTDPGGSTTTTDPGSTTTTDPSSTTTTVLGGGGGGSTTTTSGAEVLGDSVSPVSGTSVVSELPRTGTPATSFIFWSVLFLVFGRMAILLGRTPKVIAAKT